ncbi:CDGSH iron-sulfur domain-containing protein [Mycolicibacterium sp. CH28]|uniref:CDGSH iron-sulfur domain-containing protein n=1 Tax=Mycolicibacterium sp. CH28 TaxID=2512237 RepID=UPI001081CC83|nr:CDGSH iron-sulfur domain-containing protein [Mycolicibacterium sp. CH28]TGD89643.1 CDGSH iron-sulfur domain-containing protein [Mycolicibacterium sp. CH28]
MSGQEARLVRIVSGGPMMIQGPVRIELPDGDVVDSDRFMVAICMCRRSKTYPLCDTSHRRRKRDDEPSAQWPS